MSAWYAAVLEFETSIDGLTGDGALCELSIRLVLAGGDVEAREKALAVGAEAVHSYRNEDGELVLWNFRGLRELQRIESEVMEDGVEVFSRLYRRGTPVFELPERE